MNIEHYRFGDTKYKIQKFNKLTKIWVLYVHIYIYNDCEELYRCFSIIEFWSMQELNLSQLPIHILHQFSVKMRRKREKTYTYETFATIRFNERFKQFAKFRLSIENLCDGVLCMH